MKNTLLLSMALMAPALVASAAETCDTTDIAQGKKLHYVRTTESDAKILDAQRPHGANEIPTPKFVLKSDNNAFMMTFGGQLNLIVGGDIDNNLYKQSGAGISFVTNQIPVPATPGHKGDFYINPINGFVDMQIVGFGGTDNQLTGYFKVGTNGITKSLALQRAYISYRGFTGGMKLTLFQDDYACQPPTIDPEGPSGEVSTLAYELNYTSKSYNGFRFAVGLDIPTFYSSNGYYRGHDYADTFANQQVSVTDYDQIVPDIPMWVEYSWSTWNRIRLSGIVRNFAYKDLVSDKTRHTAGWGVMLSGNVQPASKWILYYQLAYGQGIGNYIQDLAGLPYSFTPSDSQPGKMVANPMIGANLGVTYNISPKWQVNAMFSEARIFNVKDYATAEAETSDYKYALYGAVNCFYNINSFMQVGLEYLWGHRQTWNIGGAHDSRLQAQLQFSF